MSDDPEFEHVDNDLLHRADTLLNRHRAPDAALDIPILTQIVGGNTGPESGAIPTLTDRIAPPAPEHEIPPGAPPSPAMEYGLRELLTRQFGSQFASGVPPETAAALEQAAGKIAAQLTVQLDVVVRAAVEEALERLAQSRDAAAAPGIMRGLPDTPPPEK